MQSTKKHRQNVAIINVEDLPSGDLRELLHTRGYGTEIIISTEEIGRILQKLAKPILLVLAGKRREIQNEVEAELVKLADKAKGQVPLLIAHEMPIKAIDVLRGSYDTIVTLQGTSNTRTILEALHDVELNLSRRAPRQAIIEGYDDEIKSTPDDKPTRLEMAVSDFDLGGQSYAIARSPEKLEKWAHDYLPNDLKVRAAGLGVASKLSAWTLGHIHRVAFLMNRFGRFLELTEPKRQLLSATWMILPYGLTKAQSGYLREPFEPTGKSQIKDFLATAIDLSSKHARTDLKNEPIALMLEKIRKAYTSDDETLSEDIALLYGCDWLDRKLWTSGVWNPVVAYHLIRYLQEPESNIWPSSFKVVIRKFLAEATTAVSQQLTTRGKVKNNKELIAEAALLKKVPDTEFEHKVKIASAVPGMRLTRSLKTFDGKELIEPSVTLDRDLLRRLWQLSSIRAINDPMVVQKEAEAESSK
jgi:hypothetical protein